MLHIHTFLQFKCSGGDTTEEVEVEADALNRGITTLCGFPSSTKVTCSAQAGNSAGFSSSVSEDISVPDLSAVGLESKTTDTAQCK